MPTKRQIAANQRNARLSTGPATEDGKARSAQNATLHGLLAREAVLPEEDASHFRDLLAALEAELQPAGALEEFLVREMASAQWRLRRALRIETGGFAGCMESARRRDFDKGREKPRDPSTPEELHDRNTLVLGSAFFYSSGPDAFSKLARYENSLRRAYYKALQTLEKSRAAEPLRNEPNSPPPPPPDPPTEATAESPASPAQLPASDESCILQSGGFGSWTPFWRCIDFTSPSPSRSTISSRSSPWALPC
ncbi:MAG: hypothetical protein ABSH46_17000 [Bryobacteraceae bacterium]